MRNTRIIAILAAMVAFALAGPPAKSAVTVDGSVQYSTSDAVPAAILTNGNEVEDLEGPAGSGFYFQFYVPAGARNLKVESDGDGDVDLLLANGWMPDLEGFQYGSFDDDDADEKIEIDYPASGTWYLLVYGRDNFDDVEIEASWDEPRGVVIYPSYYTRYYSPGTIFFGTFGLNRVRRPIIIHRSPLLHRFHHHQLDHGRHHGVLPHKPLAVPHARPPLVTRTPRLITPPRPVLPGRSLRGRLGAGVLPRTPLPRTVTPRTPIPRTFTPRTITPRAVPRTISPRTGARHPGAVIRRPSTITRPRVITPPRNAVPRVTRPRTSTPRSVVPRTITPRTSPPRTFAPRTIIPRTSRPRVTLPQQSRPRVTLPQQSRPRVTLPQQSRPRVTMPQFSRPHVNAPQSPSRSRSFRSRPSPSRTAPSSGARRSSGGARGRSRRGR